MFREHFCLFFVGDILEYSPKEEVQKIGSIRTISSYVFKTMLLVPKTRSNDPSLANKNKEIRNKLKVSNSLVSILKSYSHNTDRLGTYFLIGNKKNLSPIALQCLQAHLLLR